MPPSPEQMARAQALLSNPNVPESQKAALRAKLGMDAAPAPGGSVTGVHIGEAQNIREGTLAPEPNDSEPDRDVDDVGGGGAEAPPGGSGDPYASLVPPAPRKPATGMPGPSPSESGADRVLGYLRSGLHGLDRSVTFGLGTSLGEMVDPGTRARGETAAAKYPVAQVLGMLGGALIPSGLAAQAGRAGGAAADTAIHGGSALARVGRGIIAGGTGAALQDVGEDVAAGRPVEGAGGAALAGGVIGGVLGGLGAVGGAVRNRIRDPADQVGRDIASAEKIGSTTRVLSGVEKGPIYEGAEREARASTEAGSPISPAGIAERRAVPELGRSVQADIDTRLGKMGAENAQVGDEMVSLQPVLDKSLGRLRRMMRDQKPLPGMSTRGLADTVKKSADVQLVDVTDSALDSVDPENILEAGEAAAMGLIPKGSNLQGKAVILTPRQVSPRELEDIRGAYDSAGKVSPQNIKAAGEVENARAVAGAAREARIQLGPEAIDRAARHEKSLGEMENVINAAGLPPGARKVDLGDLATKRQLSGAVRNYRTRGNEGAGVDQVLDQLAGRGPLRGALDEAAGVAAIERMRREAATPLSPHGIGNYGFKGWAQLRADALLRYLENGVGATARPVGRGLIPASVSAAQPTRRQP